MQRNDVVNRSDQDSRSQRSRLVYAILLLPLIVLATEYDGGYCEDCGNSSEGRSNNTLNRLNQVGAAARNGDTVRLRGGDGSDATYRMVNRYATLRWQCASGCGPGDRAPWFYQSDASSGGGGSGGEGGGTSGDGSGGGGGIAPIYTAATVCAAGVCQTEWIVTGFQRV